MAFADVRRAERARGAENEQVMQDALGAPGAVAVPGGVSLGAMPGSHGDVSDKFYDEPVVGALAKLPSRQQAEQMTGASPSFYGVQRPGDWQRVVQRQAAAQALPGGQEQLAKLIGERVARANRGGML